MSTGSGDVVGRLRATHATGRTRRLEWRREQLQRLDALLEDKASELAAALVDDLRRTEFEAILFEIASTRGEVRHALKNVGKWMRPRRVHAPLSTRPARAWYQYEPLGVSLIIGPWNYPIHLTLAPLVGALAAGNCAVLKPSEVTPAAARTMATLVPQYFDDDTVVAVEGGPDTTQALIERRPDHVFFTGSPEVGSAVAETAGRHLVPVTLELGGKCPAIVTSSADLGVAARRIAFGKLVNAGQTCVAPDYVLVDDAVREPFVQELLASVRTFTDGRALPIVNTRHAERVARLLKGAGGTTVLGGEVDVADATSPELTVVLDPAPDAALLRDEIFGPVLPVITVDSLDAAIQHIHHGSSPLATYLFTKKRADEVRALDAISTGATVVNHVMMHLAVNDLPFGGVGRSGSGKYHGRWGFEAFSHPKAVLRKPSRPDPRFIYPPYNRFVQALMKRMM